MRASTLAMIIVVIGTVVAVGGYASIIICDSIAYYKLGLAGNAVQVFGGLIGMLE